MPHNSERKILSYSKIMRELQKERLSTMPFPPNTSVEKECSTEELELPHRLSNLHNHDCLLTILAFLSWEDLNVFSLASKGCHRVRSDRSLDQTSSGTIELGNGVSNVKELMDKARIEQWSNNFCGHRTHLRLSGLTYLSSNIDPIDADFIDTIAPLHNVTSLDCSMMPPALLCGHSSPSSPSSNKSKSSNPSRQNLRPWFFAPFEDYVDKGFAQGLTLSLLAPNVQSIDMSYLPLTMIGVAWLTENNPKLEIIQWNHSLIWPISNDSENHFEALQYLKEVYLDDARMIFCADINDEVLWNTLLNHAHHLQRVSLLGTRWYRKGQLAELSQDYLLKFVRGTPTLRWFRSDLTPGNVQVLEKERPEVVFVSGS